MTNITGSAGAIQPLSKLHKEGEVRREEEVWVWKTTLPAFNKMSHPLPTQQLRTDQRGHWTAGPCPLSNQTEDPSCKFHPDQERMLRTVLIGQWQKRSLPWPGSTHRTASIYLPPTEGGCGRGRQAGTRISESLRSCWLGAGMGGGQAGCPQQSFRRVPGRGSGVCQRPAQRQTSWHACAKAR